MKLFKKASAFFIAVFFIILPVFSFSDSEYTKKSYTFFGSFDTVIQVIGYTNSDEVFDRNKKIVEDTFNEYHKYFDAYNAYEGINNLYYLNQNAAKAPVKVPKPLFDLIKYSKEIQPFLRNTLNIAMGSVLELWHDARDISTSKPSESYIPGEDALIEASVHTDIDSVVLDEANMTIFFLDDKLSINLGAIAKGYTTEVAAQKLINSDMPSFLINAGGNVRTGASPLDGRVAWGVLVKDPKQAILGNNQEASETLFLQNLSVVTSGDYERYFTHNGENYHHIIDPKTLAPSKYMHSVTIITKDSAFADLLSTVLFLLSYEDGLSFISTIPNTGAIWVLNDYSIKYTDNIKHLCKTFGAGSATLANIE